MRPSGGSSGTPAAAPVRGPAVAGRGHTPAVGPAVLRSLLVAWTVVLGGCAAWQEIKPGEPVAGSGEQYKVSAPVERVRAALDAGDLLAADTGIAAGLTVPASEKPKGPEISGAVIQQTPLTAELLVLRAELRIRQRRFAEAESDALTAMALVPATPPVEEPPGAAPPGANDASAQSAAAPAAAQPSSSDASRRPGAPARRPAITQRWIHIRLAHLLEDAGRDDGAERHLAAARKLCLEDDALAEHGDCDAERDALARIGVARGHYADAEPVVLAEIADVQSRYGAHDLRLSFALCHVASFYARQGKYELSGPLFTRSFDVWKTARDDAFGEYTRAIATGAPSPFDAEFLRPRAGHAPFAEPCGLSEQPGLLYKLGKAGVAADAIRFEQQLWAGDTEAGPAAVSALDALIARSGDALDIAAAHHAVAFVAQKKGDIARAEQELRLVTEAYAKAWPKLPVSERRYRSEDYLTALESLIELLRSSRRYPEAIALGDTAVEVASGVVDAYDSERLDTLLSVAKTFREMRDSKRAEAAAARYLDAIVAARGDRSADYAWALRTISFAYLLRDELDASQRMEMQAKAIWAKQSTVAPEF